MLANTLHNLFSRERIERNMHPVQSRCEFRSTPMPHHALLGIEHERCNLGSSEMFRSRKGGLPGIASIERHVGFAVGDEHNQHRALGGGTPRLCHQLTREC